MERYYSIAGIDFRVAGENLNLYDDDGILTGFRSEGFRNGQKLTLRACPVLDPPEGRDAFSCTGFRIYTGDGFHLRYEGVRDGNWKDAYMRVKRTGDHSDVQLLREAADRGVTPGTVLRAMELEHQITDHGGFLFHSAYIRSGQEAILFTGPSGIGKSTQAELWRSLRGAELINGDRSVVMLEERGVMVYGVPYSGSSHVSLNRTLPLRAIVRLSQAQETSIQRLTGLRAFREVWGQCSVNTWNAADVDRCIRTVTETVSTVPVYHLACTPDESAVTALEHVLKE